MLEVRCGRLKVRKALLNDFAIEIGGGLGQFAGKVWRVGLMGHSCRRKNVFLFLSALEAVLKAEGFKTRPAPLRLQRRFMRRRTRSDFFVLFVFPRGAHRRQHDWIPPFSKGGRGAVTFHHPPEVLSSTVPSMENVGWQGPSLGNTNDPAGDARTRGTGRLCGEIVRLGVYDYSSTNNRDRAFQREF